MVVSGQLHEPCSWSGHCAEEKCVLVTKVTVLSQLPFITDPKETELQDADTTYGLCFVFHKMNPVENAAWAQMFRSSVCYCGNTTDIFCLSSQWAASFIIHNVLNKFPQEEVWCKTSGIWNSYTVLITAKSYTYEIISTQPGLDTHTPYHRDPLQILDQCNGMSGYTATKPHE